MPPHNRLHTTRGEDWIGELLLPQRLPAPPLTPTRLHSVPPHASSTESARCTSLFPAPYRAPQRPTLERRTVGRWEVPYGGPASGIPLSQRASTASQATPIPIPSSSRASRCDHGRPRRRPLEASGASPGALPEHQASIPAASAVLGRHRPLEASPPPPPPSPLLEPLASRRAAAIPASLHAPAPWPTPRLLIEHMERVGKPPRVGELKTRSADGVFRGASNQIEALAAPADVQAWPSPVGLDQVLRRPLHRGVLIWTMQKKLLVVRCMVLLVSCNYFAYVHLTFRANDI